VAELRCIPLKQVTDGPLFGTEIGTLSSLTNMRLRRGGYAEARGGMEKLKPSGGTSAEPVTSGGTPAGIQVATSNGWIRTWNQAGASWSGNLQFSEGNYPPFPTGAVNDAIYFGADAPFGRIGVKIQNLSTSTLTFVYEYWNGAAWTALTTQETITWTAVTFNTIDSYASWQIPSDWALVTTGTNTNGNVLKYWMRIRVSVSTAVVALPTLTLAQGAWIGMRELYLMSQQPFAAGPNGRLIRYDQTAAGAGTAQYFLCNSAMYSGPDGAPSIGAYKGRVYTASAKEMKRWDGRSLEDMGLPKPGAGGTVARAVGAGLGAGIWRYYFGFGYGPLMSDQSSTNTWPSPLYGMSQGQPILTTAGAWRDAADTSNASFITTAGNEIATIDWSALTIPANVSCLVIYRTKDLTGVAVNDRGNAPAYPVYVLNRANFTLFTNTPESNPAISGAPLAILYNNLPPKGCRYLFFFENRAFIGGGPDENWYWSDPFLPDSFNPTFQYIPFVRALGGRSMGGCEYGDQAVMFTEDQTWGFTNPAGDIPTIFPIHPAVGCVAPNSVAVGDGLLVWLSRDGVYAWDGSKQGPKNVSGKRKLAFKDMTFDAHGGSRGVIHKHRYDLTLIDAKNGTIGNAYTLDLETFEWGDRTTQDKKVPGFLIHAPLGHQDQGVPHALYLKATVGTAAASDATSYSPMVAEFTTLDDGVQYTCAATMYFPQAPGETFSPLDVLAYYQSLPNEWSNPTLTLVAGDIGSGTVGTITANTPDVGTDYNVVGGQFSQQSSGTSDIQVTFSALSQVGATVGAQRLFGATLRGEAGTQRVGMVP
jgi:hypothetical protein